jgi:nicotinamide mononucleotide transporter
VQLQEIWHELAASPPLEKAATVLGIAYALFAVQRNRLCWIAGAASSALLAYLAAGRGLPMQAALQFYYVGLSAYGFWHWTRASGTAELPIGVWSWRNHIVACVLLTIVGFVLAQVLARETNAAWPRLDALATVFSLFATWLVARARLENWLYWIVVDVVLVFLFWRQGLYFIGLLYATYTVIASVGFVTWLKKYRLQIQRA